MSHQHEIRNTPNKYKIQVTCLYIHRSHSLSIYIYMYMYINTNIINEDKSSCLAKAACPGVSFSTAKAWIQLLSLFLSLLSLVLLSFYYYYEQAGKSRQSGGLIINVAFTSRGRTHARNLGFNIHETTYMFSFPRLDNYTLRASPYDGCILIAYSKFRTDG